MQLDPQQQAAVAHNDGPLLVKAGPGSGKTHVITERVNRLVLDGIPQESILCITYTKKAAGEMQERLESNNKVWIGTLHALGKEILQENQEETGISESTRLMDILPRTAWCMRNFDDFGIDNEIISLGLNPLNQISPMLKEISHAKREMISADDIMSYIEKNPDKDLSRTKQWLKIYRAYDAHIEENDLYDFDVMVTKAVQLLGNNRVIREAYQKRYRYIMVDEFQDINHAQFQLIKLLAGHGNVMVVGDVDQAIMGFQGALANVFGRFEEAFPACICMSLTENHRCDVNIPHVASAIVRPDDGIIPIKKDQSVIMAPATDEKSEREFVAEMISKMDYSNDRTAVLCRSNRSCQAFAQTLSAHRIHVTIVDAGNIMRNPLIAEVRHLLSIAASPETASTSITYILSRRGIRDYNIKAIDRMADRARRAERDKNEASLNDCIFSTLKQYSGPDQHDEIVEITQQLERLIEEGRNNDLLGILRNIMMKYTDVYKKNAGARNDEEIRNIAVLNRLYEIAEEYENHYPDRILSDFVEYLGIAANNDTGKHKEPETVHGDTVDIMTIHNSKGKEFHTVFVTGIHDMLHKFRKGTTYIPAEMLDEESDYELEARKLLFVAMTRARKQVYLTYHDDMDAKKGQDKFLHELKRNSSIPVLDEYRATNIAHFSESVIENEKTQIQEDACKAVRESRPVAAINHIMKLARMMGVDISNLDVPGNVEVDTKPKTLVIKKSDLRLSATKIETYQKCPLQYKYKNILEIPEGEGLALRKGSVIHNALERLGNESKDGRVPDIKKAIQDAINELKVYRNNYENRDYAREESTLPNIMYNYEKWEKQSDNIPVDMEVRFEVYIDGIKYTGRVDRIEKNPDGKYEVIDYKTGKTVISKKEVMQAPQVIIYAYAVREKYGSLPAKVSLLYVGKNNNKRECEMSEEVLENGLNIIKTCGNDIIAGKFDATPGKHCEWCSYNMICPEYLE